MSFLKENFFVPPIRSPLSTDFWPKTRQQKCNMMPVWLSQLGEKLKHVLFLRKAYAKLLRKLRWSANLVVGTTNLSSASVFEIQKQIYYNGAKLPAKHSKAPLKALPPV